VTGQFNISEISPNSFLHMWAKIIAIICLKID
jgi:hypothetical protein